jgi:hypothetical protein
MNIAPTHLDALRAFGYTEAEARFLYIVATHSGYFVARQFLGFTGAHWGGRTTAFWKKLKTNRHARTERFPLSGTTYHLFAPGLYRQIDRENIRNHRRHEIEHIHKRIGVLDFILSHSQWNYLETEQEKVRFFSERLNVPGPFLPVKIYHGERTCQPTLRYFVDRFPMFLDPDSPSAAVTFTYLQGPTVSLAEFVRHLRGYLPLFKKLSEVRFLYLARFDAHFPKAKELFDALVAIPLESDVSADLLRYFQIRKAWDLGQYRSLSEDDLIFRNQTKARFLAQRFEHLYRGWKNGRVTESQIRQEFGGTGQHVTVHFGSEVLCRFGVSHRAQKAES